MKDRKLKVLHFPIRNSNGGVTRSALKYWKYIDHDRFQFDFATCSPCLDFEQDILAQGCRCIIFPVMRKKTHGSLAEN